MHVQSLTLAAACAALLAPTMSPAPEARFAAQPVAWGEADVSAADVLAPTTSPTPQARFAAQPVAWGEGDVSAADVFAPATSPAPEARFAAQPVARREGDVSAADLLAKVRGCTRVSRGRYRSDEGTPATIPVCGTRDAVFWKADLDVDCDGRAGRRCNRRTDPQFSSLTAYQQSDGRHLSAERLPYIVVPAVSRLWNHRDHGVRGGSVAAVVYRDRVQYAVVGDIGPRDVIGEASYATARGLGITPDPRRGGTPSGVTYIVFKNSQVKPIEDHAAAVAAGRRLARLFVRGG